jgi:hypothetical protein
MIQSMNDDEISAIIHRMMRDLDDDHEPTRTPRCEGCGARVPLKVHAFRRSDGGDEWLM